MKRIALGIIMGFLTSIPAVVSAQQVEYVGSALWSGIFDIKIDGNYAYCAFCNGLKIFNISDPSSPVEISHVLTSGRNFRISFYDNFIYLAQEYDGLDVVDISDKQNPRIIAHLDDLDWVWDVFAIGEYIYTAEADSGLQIISVSDPSYPVRIGAYHTNTRDIYIDSNFAYAIDIYRWRMKIIDISNPTGPVLVGIYTDNDSTRMPLGSDIAVIDDYAYVVDWMGRFTIVNVHDKYNPIFASMYAIPSGSSHLSVLDNLVYIPESMYGLQILNIYDPNYPLLISEYPAVGYNSGIDVAAGHAYMTDHERGFKVIDVSNPYSPTLDADYDPPTYIKRVTVSGDLAITSDTSQYLRLVDITNRSNPAEIGRFHLNHQIYDLQIDGDMAYIITSQGFYVIDISDPLQPIQVGLYDNLAGWALSIDSGYAFVLDGAGIHVINISDPTNPTMQGHCYFPSRGYRDDIFLDQGYAYIAASESGLYIVSISNPVDPTLVGHIVLPGYACGITKTGNYAFIANETDGINVIDVSDPANPQIAGQYSERGALMDVEFFDHFAFVSDNWSGLWVLDIDNPAHPSLVTKFHTNCPAYEMATRGNLIYLANYCSLTILRFDPITGIIENLSPIHSPSLSQNYPNPFNATTTISYDLPKASDVKIEIYVIGGGRVAKLSQGMQQAGQHSIQWNAGEQSSGVYFYKIKAGKFTETKKLILMK
jgi:hypothetical protein